MKEEAIKEFVDFIIQERMQKAFSEMKAGKEPGREDEIERKYQEAVALLPEDKQQAVRAYCDATSYSREERDFTGLNQGWSLLFQNSRFIKYINRQKYAFCGSIE